MCLDMLVYCTYMFFVGGTAAGSAEMVVWSELWVLNGFNCTSWMVMIK
jgi:hypothetical protein